MVEALVGGGGGTSALGHGGGEKRVGHGEEARAQTRRRARVARRALGLGLGAVAGEAR
jgi:hypothetical protein